MLITNKITVKNSKSYEKYNSNSKYIEIDISDLKLGSHCLVLAECDYCNIQKDISYKEYNRNINKSIHNKFSCCFKCGALKAKENNLEKYGIESISKLDSVKIKIKDTVRRKYGVDHISQVDVIRISNSEKMSLHKDEISKRVKEYWNNIKPEEIENINNKRIKTNLEKYGVENISQNKEIKDKVKETNLEKYGGFTYQSEYLLDKVYKTNLEKYGCTYSSSSEVVKDKIKETNLEKYGFEYASQSEIVKEKTKETNLEKFNKTNIMLDEDFRKKFIISNQPDYIRYLSNRNYEFFCNDCNDTYIIDYYNFYRRNLRKSKTCTVCYPINEHKSIKELELLRFIEDNYKGEIVNGYRDGLEIDIYLPELNIGFEFNGLYWHSEEYKEKNYHLDKLNWFKEKGIHVINIWEDDWDLRKDIIKSQIKNYLGLTENKIFARKCIIKEINDCKEFLENNHIQGFIRSSIKLGLFYNNELVSLMTFDQFEGRKKMEEDGWNLSRFCNVLNTNVIGSASKLLNYFIKTYNPSRIISYADKSWSKGGLYYTLGFKLDSETKPDYKYVINDVRKNKQKFTKFKLIKEGFNELLTEKEIMSNLGHKRIYDCGQLKFELILGNF